MVNLLKYLRNPEHISGTDPITGHKISKNAILNKANELCQRLIPKEIQNIEETVAEPVDAAVPMSMEEKLNKAIAEATAEQDEHLLPTSLAQDFKMYEATKKRTEHLEILFQSLMSVKPTSVESERTFSIGGGFATKVRSRMSDETLSALVTLKTFFKKNKNE